MGRLMSRETQATPTTSTNKPAAICMTHLTKRYPMGDEVVHALDDVDFTVREGEFVAIIGPSGSGKSTLMNIIGLLDVPDEGTYRLDGCDVAFLTDNELADLRNRTIGFVFQSFNLLGTLTALENVKLPLTYRGIKPRVADATAQRYLEKVGLAGRERYLPHQLSGGQQQRVAIARALVGKPEIILADEPTGALDSRTSVEIMELFQSLHDEGQTVIFITHNPDLAKQAERVVPITDGKLSEQRSAGTATAIVGEALERITREHLAAARKGGAHATHANS